MIKIIEKENSNIIFASQMEKGQIAKIVAPPHIGFKDTVVVACDMGLFSIDGQNAWPNRSTLISMKVQLLDAELYISPKSSN